MTDPLLQSRVLEQSCSNVNVHTHHLETGVDGPWDSALQTRPCWRCWPEHRSLSQHGLEALVFKLQVTTPVDVSQSWY